MIINGVFQNIFWFLVSIYGLKSRNGCDLCIFSNPKNFDLGFLGFDFQEIKIY
jgi:hypothetical protein